MTSLSVNPRDTPEVDSGLVARYLHGGESVHGGDNFMDVSGEGGALLRTILVIMEHIIVLPRLGGAHDFLAGSV